MVCETLWSIWTRLQTTPLKREREGRMRLTQKTWQLYISKKTSRKMTKLTQRRKSGASTIMSWIQIWKTMSKLIHSTSITVKTLWEGWPCIRKCGRNACAKLKWLKTASSCTHCTFTPSVLRFNALDRKHVNLERRKSPKAGHECKRVCIVRVGMAN